MTERTITDCYKDLPEAMQIPDIVWDAQKASDRVTMLRRMLALAEQEKNAITDKMLRVLAANWTLDEIDATGIRDCF